MKVGFCGTGLMGQPMVQRLLSVNVPVIAYNRTDSKLEPLKEAGAEITTSVAQVLSCADCIIVMLTNAEAIREVLFSSQSSLTNRTIIQMGTISPSESKVLAQEVEQKGGDYLEAPVLGSIPEAKQGTLLVMVGASESQFQQWGGLLQHFGTEPVLIGPVGTAAALKLSLNQLIASLTTAFSLSLGFLQKQGVDIDKFMTILRQSALYAPTFDKKLQRMCQGNYENPNFPTKHLLKDIDLFMSQAQEIGLNVIPLDGVRQVVQTAMDLGFAESDYSALYSAIMEVP